MAFDFARGQTVLFGGLSSSGFCLGDTWLWNGSTWIAANGPGPSARLGAVMAYDLARARTVLFGGRGPTGTCFCDVSDTWEWDGTTWTQRSPLQSPPATAEAQMTYDWLRGRTVLVGSFGAATSIVWEWDGNNWSLRSPVAGPAPPPLDRAMAAYDPLSGRTLLF